MTVAGARNCQFPLGGNIAVISCKLLGPKDKMTVISHPKKLQLRGRNCHFSSIAGALFGGLWGAFEGLFWWLVQGLWGP